MGNTSSSKQVQVQPMNFVGQSDEPTNESSQEVTCTQIGPIQTRQLQIISQAIRYESTIKRTRSKERKR